VLNARAGAVRGTLPKCKQPKFRRDGVDARTRAERPCDNASARGAAALTQLQWVRATTVSSTRHRWGSQADVRTHAQKPPRTPFVTAASALSSLRPSVRRLRVCPKQPQAHAPGLSAGGVEHTRSPNTPLDHARLVAVTRARLLSSRKGCAGALGPFVHRGMRPRSPPAPGALFAVHARTHRSCVRAGCTGCA
jgi:hypothetical protein